MVDAKTMKRGDPVWILGTGWWRRGRFLAALKRNVIVEYSTAYGRVKQKRLDPSEDSVQPATFDPHAENIDRLMKAGEIAQYCDRPIARTGMWEVES